MKGYKDESGNTVKEYSIEDWENGLISGQMKHGKEILNVRGGQTEFSFLPKTEYDKIQEACKKQYQNRVKSEDEILKSRFWQGIKSSLDRSKYVENEIRRCEYVLSYSARKKGDKPAKINLKAFPNYPLLYEQYVIKGEQAYHLENRMKVSIVSNENLLRHSAKVIALNHYLNWLNEILKNPRKAYANTKYFWELINEKPEEITSRKDFQRISKAIEDNGYMSFNWDNTLTKVFNAEVMYLLTCQNLTLYDQQNQDEVVLSTVPFRSAFADGFLAGKNYFDTEWHIDKTTLVSANADKFIKSLLENYFKNGISNKKPKKGWISVKMSYPLILSEDIFFDIGYYSGLVSEVDKAIDKYHSFFAPYFKPDESDKVEKYLDIETARDFFNFLSNDEIKTIFSRRSETDLQHCIHRLTKGHKLPFLESLKADLESELELELIEAEGKFDNQQILREAQRLIDRKMELPLIHGYKFSDALYKKIKNSPDECRFYIDIEELMYPMKYGTVRQVIKIISDLIEQKQRDQTSKSTQTEAAKPSPQPKTKQVDTLSKLITHQNSNAIVDAIKIRHKNIRGKQLKLLLLAFQELKLLPPERIANKFHKCCKREFNWNIASYNAMNGYSYNGKTDNHLLNDMKQFLQSLIESK